MTNLEAAARAVVDAWDEQVGDVKASTNLRATVELLRAALPASEATGVLTREQAIAACALAGYGADPIGEFDEEDVKAATAILAANERYPTDSAFARAVLAEARKHAALADSPALRSKP
jgi:hypothetical protein